MAGMSFFRNAASLASPVPSRLRHPSVSKVRNEFSLFGQY
jgi:hypothetical protein